MNTTSETTVSVSVSLEKIFDLTNAENLTPFTVFIKKFKLSKELIQLTKKFSIVLIPLVEWRNKLKINSAN